MRLLRFVGYLALLLTTLTAQPQQFQFERITVDDGLSHNDVYAIYQDTLGFMWFGTQYGLNRYDGKSFKIYRNRGELDTTTVWNSWIKSIAQDGAGNMWVSGVIAHRYDILNDNFVRYNPKQNSDYFPKGAIAKFRADANGSLWMGSNIGLEHYNPITKKFIKYDLGEHNRYIQDIDIDSEGNVWLAYFHPSVALRFSQKDGSYDFFKQSEKGGRGIPPSELYKVFVDRNDSLWLLTSHGLYSFHRTTASFKFALRDTSRRFLPRATYEMNDSILILGTLSQGVVLFNRRTREMTSVPHQTSNSSSPNSQHIKHIYGDRQGNIWFATDRGIGKISKAKKQFFVYSHNTELSNSLLPGEALNVVEDTHGNVWIALFGGGVSKFNFSSSTFTNFNDKNIYKYTRVLILKNNRTMRFENNIPVEIDLTTNRMKHTAPRFKNHSVYNPHAYLKDSKGNEWIAYINGLLKVSRDGKKQRLYQADSATGLRQSFVSTLYEDTRGTIWLNAGGLHRYDEINDRFIRSNSVRWFGGNRHVYAMHEDSKGRFWLGVAPALVHYDRNADSIVYIYNKADGILGRRIYGILEDRSGNLWLNTDEGIVKIFVGTKKHARPTDIHSYHIKIYGEDSNHVYISNYGINDGIPTPSISDYAASFYKAYCKTKSGYMVFGLGASGIIVFHPDSIKNNSVIPPVFITGFSVANTPVPIKPDSILSKNIVLADTIFLRHDQNDFSFEFAALDYTAPKSNQYKYRLEGLEEHWIEAGNRNVAYYTNIDPGEYRFHVLGSNNDGVWNEQGASVLVIIAPPWWKTTWAYAGYLFLFVSLLYSARKYELNRQRHKHLAEMEHREAENLKEVDKIKTRFFANISHEFRTPLTLIEGPLKQLLSGNYKGNTRELFEMMLRNTRRLQRLVNQLLDLAKIESHEIKLRVREDDVVLAVKIIAAAFESTAVRKNITFTVHTSADSIIGWFDADALEKILNNLLSNAFKFTPEGGGVALSLTLFSPLSGNGGMGIRIEVADTGIGIPSGHIEKIFDRFYQVDASHTREHGGTGIGLSLVKELVELHRGRITVHSEIGRGTAFIVQLPVSKEQYADQEIIISQTAGYADRPSHTETSTDGEPHYPVESGSDDTLTSLLIIEDNADMRRYIRLHVGEKFSVLEATNGEEGIERAIEMIPDIIISDVMMPKVDGFEVCKRLKADHRTSHIPVILLTAKAGQDHKVEGLETGADEYLVKPFDAQELLVRLRNLQEQRKKMREHVQRELTSIPAATHLQSADDRFLKKVFGIIEQNFGNSDFDIQTLAEESAMSRMQLHRKIKALTGYAPGELLRTVRLQRAAEMLKHRTGNISEIAYEVGYNNLSHFAAQFREKYGLNPSEFAPRG